MSALVKIHTRLWLLFFLITIVVIGGTINLLAYLPLYALSFVIPSLKPKTDQILYVGIALLMRVQPWLAADVRIDLPQDTQGRGLLLISNHRSHLDVFILLSRIRGIRILAKSTLLKIPFLSLMMRVSGQIGVERGSLQAWVRAMEQVREKLRLGQRVHVFPEMTRCAPGYHGLQSFTAGPFQAAKQENALVVPLVFRDTDRVWPKGFAGLSFRQRISVETLAPLDPKDFTTVDSLKSEVHRRIEAALV